MITDSSFFMRALKWRKSLWWTSLWSCQSYVMMCHERHLRSFFLPSFICCLFSLHAYIEDNVHFKCEGKGLENKKYVVFCIVCFSIVCILYLFSVSVAVLVCFLYLFSIFNSCLLFLSVLYFCFCCCFYFLFCYICFVLLFYNFYC